MKRAAGVWAVLLGAAGVLAAEEGVTVPWAEFSRVYRESIERDVMTTLGTQVREMAPQVFTIEDAVYQMTIRDRQAEGSVLLSGRVVSGDRTPIALFGRDLVIAGIGKVSGGTLLSDHNGRQGVFFLPEKDAGEFQVSLSFLVRAGEDPRSRVVTFGVPSAMRNSLRLELGPDVKLVEEPGLVDAGGAYRFSAADTVSIRFREAETLVAPTAVEVDTFTRVHLQGNRLMLNTVLKPVQAGTVPLQVRVDERARYISSDLHPSWIRQKAESLYEVRLPADSAAVHSLQMSVEFPGGTNAVVFRLPSIENNSGREGDFAVEEPDDGEVHVAGTGLVTGVPVARLAPGLAGSATRARFHLHSVPSEPVTVTVRRFEAVATPATVLEGLYFFTSFEENGNVLSVLAMELPAEMGPRLRLRAIPGAEIWSLTVNGAARKVYSGEQGAWVIPLQGNEPSKVQLAFLRKGTKLSLQGRLETTVPETGLPARHVRVGIALPERVDLLSVEGPVAPDPGQAWTVPADFCGKRYLFSRAFHQGEEMPLAIAYKEPVKRVGE
jgi:hypothetical protein